MKPVVLKYSRRYLPFAVLLILVGLAFPMLFVVDPEQTIETKVIVSLIGLAFAAIGVYGCTRELSGRIVVSERGVEKFSQPSRRLIFSCTWSEVMMYKWKRPSWSRIIAAQGAATYVLTATRAQLKVSSHEPIFARFHSLVLSNIGDNVKLRIRRSETPGNVPCEHVEVFRSAPGAQRVYAVIGLLLLILVLIAMAAAVVKVTGGPDPDPIFGVVMLLMLMMFGSVLVPQLRAAWSGMKTCAYRVSPSGIQRTRTSGPDVLIPWSELKSVEYLYGVVHRATRDTGTGTGFDKGEIGCSIAIGRRRREFYYYAVIGSHGDVMEFDSTMRNFGRFVASLVEHAPPHVSVYLHKDLVSIKRM